VCLVFTVRAGNDGTTGTETTPKRHQFAHPDDNLLVLELAGPFGFLVLVERVEVVNEVVKTDCLFHSVPKLLEHNRKERDHLTVEYALRDLKKPIGVAHWQTKLVEYLPKHLKGSLPTVAEIEAELDNARAK